MSDFIRFPDGQVINSHYIIDCSVEHFTDDEYYCMLRMSNALMRMIKKDGNTTMSKSDAEELKLVVDGYLLNYDVEISVRAEPVSLRGLNAKDYI